MKLVSNVKNSVSNVKNSVSNVKTNFHALAKAIKYYFYYAPIRFIMFKYYKLYELVAYKLLSITTTMVRNLIIRQGKNPDYVAPPVFVQVEPSIDDVFNTPKRKSLNVPYVPSWVRTSFRTISEHPVYKSRVNLNLQPNRMPVISSVIPAAASSSFYSNTVAPLTVASVIDSNVPKRRGRKPSKKSRNTP